MLAVKDMPMKFIVLLKLDFVIGDFTREDKQKIISRGLNGCIKQNLSITASNLCSEIIVATRSGTFVGFILQLEGCFLLSPCRTFCAQMQLYLPRRVLFPMEQIIHLMWYG